MRAWRVAVVAAAALTLASCATVAARSSPASARLENLFGDLHARGLFDGAVVVAHRDAILWEKGFGDANAEAHVPFTPQTPADGASLAKTFTAALLLSLQSDGRLILDEPAQRLLPELPYPEITLRHLITHSSGLPDYYESFEPFLGKDEVRTNERLLGIIAAQKPRLAFRPGTAFEYSSFAFDLAALAACRAARSTYAALLQERLFLPLGISSAFVRPGRLTEFPGIRTLGYRWAAGRREINDVFDLEAFHGGSNVYISARDLHRWNASFLERPLFGASALAQGLQPAQIDGSASGLTLLSWYYAPDRSAFWYSGHLQGFHSVAFRDMKTKHSIVYVSNNTLEPWLQLGLVRAIRAVLAGKATEPLAPPSTAEVPRAAWSSVAGRWRMDDGEVLAIESGERLTVRRNGVRYFMFQVDPRTFYVPGLDFNIGFTRDAGGALDRMQVSTNLRRASGTRQR